MRLQSSKNTQKEKILLSLCAQVKTINPSKLPFLPSFLEHYEEQQHPSPHSIVLLVCHQLSVLQALALRRGRIALLALPCLSLISMLSPYIQATYRFIFLCWANSVEASHSNQHSNQHSFSLAPLPSQWDGGETWQKKKSKTVSGSTCIC